MFWLIAVIVLVVTALIYLQKVNRYWLERGVKQCNPVPLFGDNSKTLIRAQSFPEWVLDVYNRSPNEKYIGIYQFLKPTLVLRDPDLIKAITVKDFEHFLDHRTILPEDSEPLWAKNLFALKGQRWRDMRSTLSPSFTSSKMRQMFMLMSKTGEQFTNYFLKQKEDVITIELKDVFTRFCNDVIASSAFGFETDSLEDRNNQFYIMGIDATDFKSFLKSLKFFGYLIVPKLYEFFKIKIFSKEVSAFFRTLVKDTINFREKNNIVRPDMIYLLTEARKNGLKFETNKEDQDAGFATVEESSMPKIDGGKKMTLTDDDITAQALIFFFAGFDSVSTLMCFTAYELTLNPEIQQRLIDEIDETSNNNPKLTYEALTKMKYLDMVVSETLRKWPNAFVLDRICTKPYTIEPTNPGEKPLYLEKDTLIWIPTIGLHRDPKYYPNPEKFDPERFSDENKDKIPPYAYIPFGSGPRNCIGSRFALLETKALFFYLLSNFELVKVDKTPIPLKLSKKAFNLNCDEGFWVGLKRRKNKIN